MLFKKLFHFTTNIYFITSDLKTICVYIALSSCLTYCRYSNTHMTCLFSLWATSCIIALSNYVFPQTSKQWFICSVRSSRALIQTHRVILMLCVSMKYQNHSTGIPHFPVLTPTSLHCCMCMCMHYYILCFQLPHDDIVVIITSRESASPKPRNRLDYIILITVALFWLWLIYTYKWPGNQSKPLSYTFALLRRLGLVTLPLKPI